jgi:hypothetical protein
MERNPFAPAIAAAMATVAPKDQPTQCAVGGAWSEIAEVMNSSEELSAFVVGLACLGDPENEMSQFWSLANEGPEYPGMIAKVTEN